MSVGRPKGSQTTSFWDKVEVGALDACWQWRGCKDGKGYGTVTIQGRQLSAHRVAWEKTNGPIGAGLCVCHTCDTPLCCNPAHMFLGTPADNSADMDRKGRRAVTRGEHVTHAKLTAPDVVKIRSERASGVQLRTLAARFGMTTQGIWSVVHRQSWRHVP